MTDLDLRIGGRAIEAQWHGPDAGTAPTVVFLHEGLGCVTTWRDFPQRLAEALGWSVLVYSRFGYGLSDGIERPRPLSYMHDEARDVLPDILRTTGIRRAALFGHSDGASIAVLFASDREARARSGAALDALVLEAPHLFVEDRSIEAIEGSLEAWHEGDLEERLRRHHGRNTENAFLGWNDAWLDPDFRTWNIETEAARNDVRTLVIQARDDEYGSLQQVEAVRRLATAAVETLIFEDGGHAPHRTHPEEVLDACAAFLSEG